MHRVVADHMIEYLPALHRFAGSLTKNPHDAEDLVHDCVERALSREDQFEPGTNLRAWLFTICRNLFLNKCRKNSRRGKSIPYEDYESEIAVKPAQEISLNMEDTKDAIRSLPQIDKDVLSLVAINGVRYDEAAIKLNVPVGTVRSRLSRARSRLADRLEERGHDDLPMAA